MKNVLITGAFGGMGLAVTKLLCDSGYRVFALDKNTGEKIHENAFPITVDLTDGEDIKKAYQTVKELAPDGLFAIIHFAGIYNLDSLIEMSEEDFKRIFDINLFGVYRVNKHFQPLLKEGSRIIITTSELAPLAPLPFTGIYAITKSALDKYAFSLRMELQLLGIKVTVLRPGAVNTGMISASTTALDRFCKQTAIYKCNATRFKRIVDKVEARNIKPEKLAVKTAKILKSKRPKFIYKINRNPLLLLLNALPQRLQTFIIKQILK